MLRSYSDRDDEMAISLIRYKPIEMGVIFIKELSELKVILTGVTRVGSYHVGVIQAGSYPGEIYLNWGLP